MTLEIAVPLIALAIFAIAGGLGLCAGWALRPKSKLCAPACVDCTRQTAQFTEPPVPPFCVDCARTIVDNQNGISKPVLKCGATYWPESGEPGMDRCHDERWYQSSRGRVTCGTVGRYFKARKPLSPTGWLKSTVRKGMEAEKQFKDRIASDLSGDGPSL